MAVERDTTMTKKNLITSPAQLRAAADTVVATWRELDTVAQTKRTAHNDFMAALPQHRRGTSHLDRSSPSMLRGVELYREALEAEDVAERACHAAIVALDAAEVAEGDELALARDPKRLYDNLAALDAEHTALLDKTADVQRRRGERMGGAFQDDAKHAARRVADALPPSASLPRPTLDKPYMQVFVERVEKGVPVPSKAAQIEGCRVDERRIAANLEEQRLEEEKRAKNVAARRADRERDEAESNARMQAQAKESREQFEADARKREKLAADYLARRAGGAP